MHGSSEVSIVESQIRETISFVNQPEIEVKQKDIDGGFSWQMKPPARSIPRPHKFNHSQYQS